VDLERQFPARGKPVHPVKDNDMRELLQAVQGFGQIAVDDDIGDDLAPAVPQQLPDSVPDGTDGLQIHHGGWLSHFSDLRFVYRPKEAAGFQQPLKR
jgi:hypothetical protein